MTGADCGVYVILEPTAAGLDLASHTPVIRRRVVDLIPHRSYVQEVAARPSDHASAVALNTQ